jgi:hypothetical protein
MEDTHSTPAHDDMNILSFLTVFESPLLGNSFKTKVTGYRRDPILNHGSPFDIPHVHLPFGSNPSHQILFTKSGILGR